MKQVILVPMWLGMSPGKVASQCCHVAVKDFAEGAGARVKARVILKVPTLEEMLHIIARAIQYGTATTVTTFIDSAPTTENTEDRVTAVSIVAADETLNRLTGHLELY